MIKIFDLLFRNLTDPSRRLEKILRFNHVTLENCETATGLVVVIDVLRALTTATYAFAAGAEDIYLVGTIEQAFVLRDWIDSSMVMSEVGGLPVEGFDFGNSPPQFDGIDLSGIHLVQRTSSGTQGAVRSHLAENLLAASFSNAGATAEYIHSLAPSEVTFVITGLRPGGWGDEDRACADFIEARLSHKYVDPAVYLQRVRDSKPGQMFQNPKFPQYPFEDLDYCLGVDRFEFIMPIHRSGKHLLLRTSTL